MRAMLWKELRENIKWAVIAMIGLALAEIYGLYYFDPMNFNNRGITLCNPTFLMATSFGNAIVGLLLGFVQILPEQRRDQWAALLHRPVSRAVIFRGKAIAGLSLYLLATIPPFLLCLWLAATPGHFVAPFVPELMLAAISDICVGAAYYFAALVVALQRGSWFGARSFALLAAVYLSCSISGLHYFYVAVEASVIMAFILFTAAWGAMLSNGRFRDRPWLAQAALLAAVFYGVCGVGILATILVAAVQQEDSYVGSQYRITQEGLPIIVTANKDLTTTVTDLQGNAIHDDRYVGRRAYQNEINQIPVSAFIAGQHVFHPGDDYFNYRLDREYIQEVPQYGEPAPTQWFYLNRLGYAVGIDRRNKSISEIVDRTGFHPPGQPIARFTGQFSHWYSSPALVQEGTDAFSCDWDKETLTKFPSTDNTRIDGLQSIGYQNPKGKGYDYINIVAREQSLQIYDSKAGPVASFSYDPQVNLDRWGALELGNNSALDRFYLSYGPSAWLPWEQRVKMPEYLDELDGKGTVLHSYTLPPLPREHYPRSWQQYLSESLQSPAFWFWKLAYQKIGAAMGIERLVSQADSSFRTGWGHTKDVTSRLTFYSLLFAVVALAWARYAGMSWRRAWAWTLFVFAFNLAGLITFRLAADWPVRVPCPVCGRKRLVEETTCAHCQSGWPTPPLRGIEIFDEKNSVVAQAPLSGQASAPPSSVS